MRQKLSQTLDTVQALYPECRIRYAIEAVVGRSLERSDLQIRDAPDVLLAVLGAVVGSESRDIHFGTQEVRSGFIMAEQLHLISDMKGVNVELAFLGTEVLRYELVAGARRMTIWNPAIREVMRLARLRMLFCS
ncbi:MAG: hypothetical protein V5A49_01260 [Haloarcula sp.]